MRRTTRRRLSQGLASGLAAAVMLAACSLDNSGGGSEEPAEQDGALEAPALAELVESGELPPLEERLPAEPLVIEPVEETGVYGGEWRTAVTGPANSAVLFRAVGYDQLMAWNRDFTEPVPNLATSIDTSEDGREFTVHLREGVKWSDGQPFTADDILFVYNDILSNEQVALPFGAGVPGWLTAGGEPAVVEKVDDYTLTFTFAQPNGLFLENLATPQGGILTAWPKHYVEQFHGDYNPEADTLAQEAGLGSWPELMAAKIDELPGRISWQNPDIPTLRAWQVVQPLGEGGEMVAERNPYYWKVDPDGRQLPYLDRVVFEVIEDNEVMLLRATNGELDMHMRHFNTLTNKPVLADGRESGEYEFFDVTSSAMNTMMVMLNLTHKNPALREVFANKDVRIALSHAINREELIEAVYQGQGEPWQPAPRPESEFYDEELAKQYTEYDVAQANSLLDGAGLTQRDGQGFRLGPDGKRISITVLIQYDLDPTWVDAVELISGYWREVGIEMRPEPVDRALYVERRNNNDHDASVYVGNSGLRDALLNPYPYFPFYEAADYAVPWANWFTGKDGPVEEPPAPVREQMELYHQLQATIDRAEQAELFKQILEISKEEFMAIGTVLPTGLYGIKKNNFHNVPSPLLDLWLYPSPGPANPEQFYIADE